MWVPLLLSHSLLAAAVTPSATRSVEPSIHLQRYLANGTSVTVKPPANGDSFIDALNRQIAPGTNGVFTGGKGVLVRALLDGLSSTVVPATFIVNDIITPSTVYANTGGDWQNPNGACVQQMAHHPKGDALHVVDLTLASLLSQVTLCAHATLAQVVTRLDQTAQAILGEAVSMDLGTLPASVPWWAQQWATS